MTRRPRDSRKRQSNLESELASEFDTTVLHNKVYEDVGGDDELARYCDALAAAEEARDVRDTNHGLDDFEASIDKACERFETVSKERAREVAAKACLAVIKDGDEWTDVWDQEEIEDAQHEAREWLQMNTAVAERLGFMEELAA